ARRGDAIFERCGPLNVGCHTVLDLSVGLLGLRCDEVYVLRRVSIAYSPAPATASTAQAPSSVNANSKPVGKKNPPFRWTNRIAPSMSHARRTANTRVNKPRTSAMPPANSRIAIAGAAICGTG